MIFYLTAIFSRRHLIAPGFHIFVFSIFLEGFMSKHTEAKKISARAKILNIQSYRRWIQAGFAGITIWIGLEFALFVAQIESGISPTSARPPGVEAFLPISALISLKYWIVTGIFSTIHPASLVLLLIFLMMAVALKKGFCSWVCPFGLLSEMLASLHKKIFDRQLRLPRWLDYPLRSLKYALLSFFLWAVLIQMGVFDLKKFIYSPYNRIADIKMLYFFTDMSETTFWTLMILVAMSLSIPYFWCRYLCPYGALLGAISWLSPFKIRRNLETCIDCEKCARVCPSLINVHKERSVISDECHACLHCVDICPVKDTLDFTLPKRRLIMPRKIYALAIIIIFSGGVVTAKISGFWQNSIPVREYMYRLQHLDGPEYQHNRGEVPDYDADKWQDDVTGPKEPDKNRAAGAN